MSWSTPIALATGDEGSPSAPKETHDRRHPATLIVWRQDDNGNQYEVRRCGTREEAVALAAEMEARGHKQLYWVAPA